MPRTQIKQFTLTGQETKKEISNIWIKFIDSIIELDVNSKLILRGSGVEIFEKPSTGVSSVNLITIDTTENGVEIVGANSNRRNLIIQNQGNSPILLNFSDDVSITNYRMILPAASGIRSGDGGSFVTDIYKGNIKGITEADSSIISVFEEEV